MPELSTPIKTAIVARADGIDRNTTAHTASDMPNVEVVSMSWWYAIGVRALRTYMTTLTGLLSAKFTGLDQGVLPADFGAAFLLVAQVALAPAVMSILLNSTELLTKLDQTNPGLRA